MLVISLCSIPIINILNSIMIVVTLCSKSIIVSRVVAKFIRAADCQDNNHA
jgi:hypothetical protein